MRLQNHELNSKYFSQSFWQTSTNSNPAQNLWIALVSMIAAFVCGILSADFIARNQNQSQSIPMWSFDSASEDAKYALLRRSVELSKLLTPQNYNSAQINSWVNSSLSATTEEISSLTEAGEKFGANTAAIAPLREWAESLQKIADQGQKSEIDRLAMREEAIELSAKIAQRSMATVKIRESQNPLNIADINDLAFLAAFGVLALIALQFFRHTGIKKRRIRTADLSSMATYVSDIAPQLDVQSSSGKNKTTNSFYTKDDGDTNIVIKLNRDVNDDMMDPNPNRWFI